MLRSEQQVMRHLRDGKKDGRVMSNRRSMATLLLDNVRKNQIKILNEILNENILTLISLSFDSYSALHFFSSLNRLKGSIR